MRAAAACDRIGWGNDAFNPTSVEMPNSGFLGFAEASEFCLAQHGVQGVLVHEAFVGVVGCLPGCTCAHDDLCALMGPPKLRMERRPCKRCLQFRSWPLAMYVPRPLAIKRVLRVLQPLAAEQVQHGVFTSLAVAAVLGQPKAYFMG